MAYKFRHAAFKAAKHFQQETFFKLARVQKPKKVIRIEKSGALK